MSPPFPIGLSIVEVGGILENYRTPLEPQYSIVLRLSSGAIAQVRQSDISELLSWPEAIQEMPSQFVAFDGELVGSVVSNAFLRRSKTGLERSADDSQLFLVLGGQWIMGVLPTQRGTRLHVEALLTSPLFRAEDQFIGLDGQSVSLSDMVGL